MVLDKRFVLLEENECVDINGGIGFVAAVVFIAKVTVVVAVTGFVAGAIYEAFMG